jgi:hypothetical protein
MPVITSYSLANSVSGALNTFVTAGDQARPTVHVKGNDWFAAWESGGSVIHAAKRDQDGAEDIAYGSLNQTSPATDPEVAELTIDERIALVYTAGSAGATNIVGRVSSGIFSGDTFTAPEFTISTDFTGPHTNADVAAGSSDRSVRRHLGAPGRGRQSRYPGDARPAERHAPGAGGGGLDRGRRSRSARRRSYRRLRRHLDDGQRGARAQRYDDAGTAQAGSSPWTTAAPSTTSRR